MGFIEQGGIMMWPLVILSIPAPLLGLLTTVVGMVQASSKLAVSHAGMDISLLANGIWHALLTTAAGLVIVVPGRT